MDHNSPGIKKQSSLSLKMRVKTKDKGSDSVITSSKASPVNEKREEVDKIEEFENSEDLSISESNFESFLDKFHAPVVVNPTPVECDSPVLNQVQLSLIPKPEPPKKEK
jgi:hypothetical protein